MWGLFNMEPFLFKSYDRILGIACDLESLITELQCVSDYDYDAANYHVINGHVSMWLNYMGFPELAKNLTEAKSPEEAIKILKSSKKGKTKTSKPAGKPQRTVKKKIA